MCYNNAKSWQLGWYGLNIETLDFSQRGGFNGTLVGVNDYQNAAATGKYVVVKIVGGTTGDLYVGFNRQLGINANTQEAFNQVTVQLQQGTGKSSLQAKLSAGGQLNVTNFQNTNKTLIIKVTSIKPIAIRSLLTHWQEKNFLAISRFTYPSALPISAQS